MKKNQLLLIILIQLLSGTFLQAQSNAASDTQKQADAPTITITRLDVNDTKLELSYDIINKTKQDIWILHGTGKTSVSAEIFMDKDNHTLLIRNRFDVPFGGGDGTPKGRYDLLRPRQTCTMTIKLAIPVYPQYGFFYGPRRKLNGLEYATSLVIEIGYYPEDLPDMVKSYVEKADRISQNILSDEDKLIKGYFKGSTYYSKLSEDLRSRDEELYLPYTYQWLKGEQILRTTIDNIRIQYEEKDDYYTRLYSVNIPLSNRIEIKYEPSALDYFFPYKFQQSLLNHTEIESLRSLKKIVLENQENLKIFIDSINSGIPTSGIVCKISSASVFCYRDDKLIMTFPIYNDDSVIIGRDRFTYEDGFQSLRLLTQEVQPIELRIQCASNLRNLWYLFCIHHKNAKPITTDLFGRNEIKPYPIPEEWCSIIGEQIIPSYRQMWARTVNQVEAMESYICPSAGEGQCHYAMNPNCEPNSPGDMVLLFETKAGWNQHGGPELFTFDNHKPKGKAPAELSLGDSRGGCVLFNDGTVKFIRTEEELKALRWK